MRSRGLLAVAGAALALLAIGFAAWPNGASSAPAKVAVLGVTGVQPDPDCPSTISRSCQALGKTTGFQAVASGKPSPFVAPFTGKLVSWSLDLGDPRLAAESSDLGPEIPFFDETFGMPPQARIAILRRIPKSKPPKYKLVRQSPTVLLTRYFGQSVVFTLDNPLTVLKDQVVGLTVPTWIPAFQHSGACDSDAASAGCQAFGADYQWRASRQAGKCGTSTDPDVNTNQIKNGTPQQVVGSDRQYGCYYSGARLLYTALLVKEPGGGSAKVKARLGA